MSEDRRVRFEIRVKPGSSRMSVGGVYGDTEQLVVTVSSPAVDGKANAAVIVALAQALNIPRRTLAIARGASARSKLIEYVGSDAHVLERVTQLRYGYGINPV